MPEAYLDPRSISSLEVLLNDLKVGTIVRTPGDFNAFSFEAARSKRMSAAQSKAIRR